MSFFRRKGRATESPDLTVSDDEAQKAISRAERDKLQAEIDLAEMKARARWSRAQRQENHFAPLIWDAMKPKGP